MIPSPATLFTLLCSFTFQDSLTDSSAYVRKTGVLGVLKIFHIAPQRIKDSDFVEVIYNMIRDRDPQVVHAAVLRTTMHLEEVVTIFLLYLFSLTRGLISPYRRSGVVFTA